ncbi:MAG: hypothetical protein RLZZ630_1614 [Bacteroidota bacterium]|jgi:gliding motility-associated-like protein
MNILLRILAVCALLISANTLKALAESMDNPFIVIVNTDFTYSDTCSGSPTLFTALVAGQDSVRWDFDDPSSGILNTSTALNPQHLFSNPGTFDVTLTAWTSGVPETETKTIFIIETPSPDLGPDISSCAGTAVTLDPGPAAGALTVWSDASTGNTLTVTQAGIYWVKLDRQGCIATDTISVLFYPVPLSSLGNDRSICDGQSLVLDPGFQPSATYLWQDGSSTPTYIVSTPGAYSVTVSIGGCSSTSTVQISVDPSPQVFLGNDTVVCKGFPIFLDATNQNASYIWQDGSTNPFIFADDPGFYSVLVSVGNCIAGDTIFLDQQDKPSVFLGEDSLLCSGQPLILNAFNYGATYTWQDGSTESTFQPGVTGFYFVTAENRCGVAADSIQVTFVTCDCLVYLPGAFSPNRDNKNELFKTKVNCTEYTGKLEIYNRLGQLLFESEDPEDGWDGTWKGKDVPEGVYVYVLKYSGYDNGRYINKRKREPFLLIR